ncbi:MAG: TIGR02300 family protein [Beijerinckiaceae bacterium]
MVKPELGSKRQCLSCGTKFFDLGRDPILCPKCGTVFQVAMPTRAAQRAAAAAAQDEDSETDAGPEMVSLEDADAEAGAEKVETTDDDIEIEDDEAADDTFLEEEEEDNDDVSDLIDGDIEDDEEG